MTNINHWLSTGSNRLDELIYDEYKLPEGAVSLFRIVYAAFVIFVAGVPQYRWIAERPDFFYNPPTFSLANLFDGFPGYPFLFCLDLLLVSLFVFLLFGLYTRAVTLLIGIVMVVGFSFYYSFGKINHDALLMIYVPFVMFFSNWNQYYSLDRRRKSFSENRKERHWPVLLLALLLGFGMFSAGVPKMLDGWLSLSTQAVKGFVVNFNYYDTFPDRFLQPYLISFDNPVFWELMDYSAVFFEIFFLLAVIRRRLFMAFIVFAVIFHTMNILFFSISFVNNLALYLLFIDWKPVLDKFQKLPYQRVLNFPLFLLILCLVTGSYLLEVPFNFHFLTDLAGMSFLTSSLVISILANFYFVFSYARHTNLSRWGNADDPYHSNNLYQPNQ
ncbi:MAG: HTTM domain-containing protein [Cyclobacteriaceae bacterium]